MVPPHHAKAIARAAKHAPESVRIAAAESLALAPAPEATDLRGETDATRKLYQLEHEDIGPFGRQCLLARRLVERGVRFVQVFCGAENTAQKKIRPNWDSHEDVLRDHGYWGPILDSGAAALLTDLKSRGLLESTLVICTTEFGCGLDGLLRRREYELTGILNGVDYDEWNTTRNPALPSAYDADQLSRGLIAYGAIIALQSPEFVAGVQQYAIDPAQRQRMVAQIVADPAYAATLPGAPPPFLPSSLSTAIKSTREIPARNCVSPISGRARSTVQPSTSQ